MSYVVIMYYLVVVFYHFSHSAHFGPNLYYPHEGQFVVHPGKYIKTNYKQIHHQSNSKRAHCFGGQSSQPFYEGKRC